MERKVLGSPMEYLREAIVLGVAGVSGLVWLVRLEAKALGNEREIRRLWNQRKEDLEQLNRDRDDTNQMLTEIRADIKRLTEHLLHAKKNSP